MVVTGKNQKKRRKLLNEEEEDQIVEKTAEQFEKATPEQIKKWE